MSYIPEEEFNKKVDLRLWKRLLQYALRWKKLLAGVVVCLFTVSFVDILYPLLSKYAIDHFVEQRTTSGILTYVLVTIGMIILQSICSTFFVMGGGAAQDGCGVSLQNPKIRLREEALIYGAAAYASGAAMWLELH